MAKAKKGSKKSKSGLTIEQEQEILSMKPLPLAAEAAREDNSIDKLKEQRKSDGEISTLEERLKEHKEELNAVQEIVEAKERLEELKEAHKSKDHLNVEEDLKALKKGWNDDIRQRSKRHKFMKKALKRHIETGALK